MNKQERNRRYYHQHKSRINQKRCERRRVSQAHEPRTSDKEPRTSDKTAVPGSPVRIEVYIENI